MQSLLSLDQSMGPQVLATVEQQVEREIDKVSGRSLRQGCLKRGKIRCAVLVDGMIVMMLDQHPIGPLAAVAVAAHANQDEAAVQALAFERELEVTLSKGLFR